MKILPSDALAPVGSYLISGKVETKDVLKSLAANQDQWRQPDHSLPIFKT
jgi:hypothetical protein